MNNKSYLVSLSKGSKLRYLTMSNQRGQPRTMCFERAHDAHRCRDYVIGYKTAYGHWPSLDMSVMSQKIEYKNEKIKNFQEIYEQVNVQEIDTRTFDHYCEYMNMNFLICKSFNAYIDGNKHDVNFTGSEYTCENDDMFSNVKTLNNIYEKL